MHQARAITHQWLIDLLDIELCNQCWQQVVTCFAAPQHAPRFTSGAQQPGPNSIGQEPQLHHDEGPVKGAQPGNEGITPQAGHAAGQADQQQGPDISRLPPLLQQQWDHTKNTHLGSISIAPNRCIRVWWMCDKCPLGLPHRWQATVNSRGPTRQTGCPYCAGKSTCAHNSLAAQEPTVTAQWSSRNTSQRTTRVAAISRSCGIVSNVAMSGVPQSLAALSSIQLAQSALTFGDKLASRSHH